MTKDKSAHQSIMLNVALIRRINEYIERQRAKPTRVAVVEAAVNEFLDREEPDK